MITRSALAKEKFFARADLAKGNNVLWYWNDKSLKFNWHGIFIFAILLLITL